MTRYTITTEKLPENERLLLEELMTNCEENKTEDYNKPQHFPLPEEDDEEEPVLRRSNLRQERPKTYTPTLSKKKDDLLVEFKGVYQLEINSEKVEINPKETLRFYNNNLEIIGANMRILRRNIALKKGTKLIEKCEVEIRDDEDVIYRLHFRCPKEAKNFQELERSLHPGAASPNKIQGAWFQIRRLLKKRSSRDLLESKGILRNEPVFGNTLEELCDGENLIPRVILEITKLIELPENIQSLGLYRASANLAVVQNIRFEINSGNWAILEKYRFDADVLANTLKLFFRELKKPIISYPIYAELKEIMATSGGGQQEVARVIEKLPRPNRETLFYIFGHLLKVCQHKNENKMDLHNISICWGPTLITLPDNCTDLVSQTTEFTKLTEDLLIYYSTVLDLTPQESVKVTDDIYDVIARITNLIELKIETEGIYRKSGSSLQIEKILKLIQKKDLSDLEKFDVYDLCGVLKKYVAMKRPDIIPDRFFFRYLEICDNKNLNVRDEIRRMVNELERKEVVYLLFEHLSRVIYNERKNKMSLGILSDMWMATLITNVQNYKHKFQKYTNLFLIMLNLSDLPDLVADPKMRYLSKYDNVPEENELEDETTKISTKL